MGNENSTFKSSTTFQNTPLKAFTPTATLSQSGGGSSANIDYSRLVFSNDLQALKGLTIKQIYDMGYIKSINTTIRWSFVYYGGTCFMRAITYYENTYVDGTTSGRGDCATTNEHGVAVRESGSCTITNNIKPITSIRAWDQRSKNVCAYYGVGEWNYTVNVTMEIDMRNYCKGVNLESSTCINYCVEPNAKSDCYTSALEYCFTKKGNSYPILDKNGQCQSIISSYVKSKDNTNIGNYTNKLRKFCKDEGITPENYLTEDAYRDLCACHMDYDEPIYDLYYQSLLKQIPQLSLTDTGAKQCLFPYCNNSKFRSEDMRGFGVCPSVKCIQSIKIDNQGTIIGDINAQTNANCINDISRGTGSGGDGGSGGGGSGGGGSGGGGSGGGGSGGGSGGGGSGGGGSGGGEVTPIPDDEDKTQQDSGPNILAIGLGLGLLLLVILIIIGAVFLFGKKKTQPTNLP